MQDPGIFKGLGREGARRRLDGLSSGGMSLLSIGLVLLVVVAWIVW